MSPLREVIESLEDLLVAAFNAGLSEENMQEVEKFYGKLRDLEDETIDADTYQF